MSNPNPQKPDPSGSEELVAYLDGELSREQSEAVERRIQDDQQARHELQQYDRVWNALDDLPRATVKESFTKTTIELAAVDAQKNLATQTALLPVHKRNRRRQLAGMVTAGLALGFALMALVMPNPNRTLYQNLPVITQLDAYSEVRDIEFLRALDAKSGSWLLEEWGPQINADVESLAQITAASYLERQRIVDDLSDDDRTDLANKARRYAGMSPTMREALDERHELIAAAPDAEKLQRTMLAYYAWVSPLPELDQAKLRSLSTEKRVAQVEKLQQRLEQRSEARLTPANAIALREAFEALASDREILRLHKKFVDALPRFDGKPTQGRGPERGRRRGVEFLRKSRPPHTCFIVLLFASMQENPLRDHPEAQSAFQQYRDAIENRLLSVINEEAAETLRKKSTWDRSRQLASWLAEARRPKDPDLKALEAFFDSGMIPPEVQQQLLAMPRDDMLRELERLYLRESLGGGDLDGDYWRRMRGAFNHSRDRGGPPNGRGERDSRGPRDRGEHRDRPPPPFDGERHGPPRRPDR